MPDPKAGGGGPHDENQDHPQYGEQNESPAATEPTGDGGTVGDRYGRIGGLQRRGGRWGGMTRGGPMQSPVRGAQEPASHAESHQSGYVLVTAAP